MQPVGERSGRGCQNRCARTLRFHEILSRFIRRKLGRQAPRARRTGDGAHVRAQCSGGLILSLCNSLERGIVLNGYSSLPIARDARYIG
jgi:hypothetical protein